MAMPSTDEQRSTGLLRGNTMGKSQFVSVRRRFTSGGTDVDVVGELDAEAAPELRRVLAAAIVTGGRIAVDLERVTFIDSSGLRALVDAQRTADEFGVDLAVVAATPAVARLLGLTDLDHLADDLSDTARSA